ncbi:hypothetical protein [Azospirillum sp. TSO22-1]|uniref:hypothetical protein n=1 Tax=Azospirillum sp. TSO22-1 TaxID=716789 RepID=UPI000D6081B6|nr:hypothetical protein [Azospirillum sp. TSO22-1]PWC54174.1 hypothetical protein TSO221_09010 [Azospirillum sp. TSO22-1]
MFTATEIEAIKQHKNFDQIIAERVVRRLAIRQGLKFDQKATEILAVKICAEVTAKVNPALIETLVTGSITHKAQKLSFSTESVRVDQEMTAVVDSVVHNLLKDKGKGEEKKTRRRLRKAAVATLANMLNRKR